MLISVVPVLLMLAPMLLLGLGLSAWKKRSTHFKGRSPLARDLLRSPGDL